VVIVSVLVPRPPWPVPATFELLPRKVVVSVVVVVLAVVQPFWLCAKDGAAKSKPAKATESATDFFMTFSSLDVILSYLERPWSTK
jgi:hypothetical protein